MVHEAKESLWTEKNASRTSRRPTPPLWYGSCGL